MTPIETLIARWRKVRSTARCVWHKSLSLMTLVVGGAVGRAALAISIGQLEALLSAIGVGAMVGGAANAANIFGGTAGKSLREYQAFLAVQTWATRPPMPLVCSVVPLEGCT
jgi:hypothetical protein